jgi:hypothetical protein
MEVLLLPVVGILGLYIINNRDDKKQHPPIPYSPTSLPESPNVVNSINQGNEKESFTTQVFTDKYFPQNNQQVPFAKTYHTNSFHDSVLDSKSGIGSQLNTKREQSPLFGQSNSTAWTNGMPLTTEYVQKRMSDIKSTKMTNVSPFPTIKESPQYISRESCPEKNIDELRGKNNVKSSEFGLYGHEGPAKSSQSVSGNIGVVQQNRTNRIFENSPSNYIPTSASVKKHTLYPLQIEKETSRDNPVEYFGSAVNSSHTSNSLNDIHYEPSKKQQLNPLPIMSMSATGKQDSFVDDYGRQHQPYCKKKLTGEHGNYLGALKGAIQHVMAPILDIIRPTRKDYMINNLQQYPRIQTSATKVYYYDPADKPSMTNRESTENSNYLPNKNNHQQGAYNIDETVGVNTIRAQTSSAYNGTAMASNAMTKPRNYEGEYAMGQLSNKKDSLSEWNANGGMGMGYNNSNTITRFKEDYRILNVQRTQQPQGMTNRGADVVHFGETRQKIENKQMNTDFSYVQDQLKKNPYALSITTY